MHIVVVPGTNRRGALTAKLGALVASHYAELADSVDLLDLGQMGAEFLDAGAYKNPPPQVAALVDRFLASDGAVFLVPEYNGSYPGVLKLFIDMLPYPQGFEGRPCAFTGLSAGQFRGLRAVEHLQQVAGYRNAYIYPRRCFIGESYRQFDAESRLTDPELERRLRDQARGFVAFVATLRKGR
jgi:NAD(P)H-dependent FMN reductase